MPEIVQQLRRLYAESNDRALVFSALLRHGVVLQGRRAAVNIRSSSTFRPGNILAVQEQITGHVLAASIHAGEIVRDRAKERASVRSGEMQSAIYSETRVEGQVVTTDIVSPVPYSVYQEFGVRQLGASGEWAGPYEYSEGKGFPGIGFMRGALDESHGEILDCYRAEGFKV